MGSQTILICDDDEGMRRLMSAMLSPDRYELRLAATGDEAAAAAEDADLLILDLHMPGRDGLSVLEGIRNDADLSGTKVLLVSGSAEAFDTDWAARVGADAHLPKPFDMATLRAAVRDLLGDPAA